MTRNAEEFCLSENLEKIIAEYGSPVRITGPGGKELMLLVSDADQVAQICSDENVFQKNKPRKGTALGIIRGDNGHDRVEGGCDKDLAALQTA